LKSKSSPRRYARLVNDLSQAYYDIDHPNILDPTDCNDVISENNDEVLFQRARGKHANAQCSYEKFLNLLSNFIDYGLYVELVQIPAQQPAQAQANQSNIVTIGRFCSNYYYKPATLVRSTSLPVCGKNKEQSAGGTVVIANTEARKDDDVVVNTHTNSVTQTITTTKNSVLPITSHSFGVNFAGVGPVDVTFELRSPDGFLSYLGSWYNVRERFRFQRLESDSSGEQQWVPYYDNISSRQIFDNGPYLSVLDVSGPSTACYSSVSYDGQTYCVPKGAKHTSMLMDIAVILRNLNISPTDLNAPVSVRVAD
jgi:hypothetical protein